jgi:hypothetical protein
MSEPVPESKPASVPEPAEDPWHAAFVEFKTRDEKMAKEYQEEIDTLLVFVRGPHRLFILRLTTFVLQAGLFSAVLSAFLVQSLQSLQEDYTKTSVDLLRHISHQLANSSLPAAPEPRQFQAQPSVVQVNMLWFVSLLLSLVTALLGMLLKQWMRAYMKWTDVTPDREAVGLRQFRHCRLGGSGFGMLLRLLPSFMELSVILFLQGLSSLLPSLDPDGMIGWAIPLITFTTYSFLVPLSFYPVMFGGRTLHRSPLPEAVAILCWRLFDYSWVFYRAVIYCLFERSIYPSFWKALVDSWRLLPKACTSWVQVDQGLIFQYNRRRNHVSTYVSAMVHMGCTTQVQSLWSMAITAIATEHRLHRLTFSSVVQDVDPYLDEIDKDPYLDEIW